MLLLALRLFLKDKGGKQHCSIPFVRSNLGVETFLKKREDQKRMRKNRRSYCPSNEMKKLGDLLNVFRKKKEKKKKMQESSVVFKLKRDLCWLHY